MGHALLSAFVGIAAWDCAGSTVLKPNLEKTRFEGAIVIQEGGWKKIPLKNQIDVKVVAGAATGLITALLPQVTVEMVPASLARGRHHDP
jgi:hypothetical protein